MGLYDSLKPVFLENKTSVLGKYGIAQCATLVAGFVAYPLETVGRRLAMQGGRIRPDYRNAMDCVRKTVEREGVKGLFRGVVFRSVSNIGVAAALVLYDELNSKPNV